MDFKDINLVLSLYTYHKVSVKMLPTFFNCHCTVCICLSTFRGMLVRMWWLHREVCSSLNFLCSLWEKRNIFLRYSCKHVSMSCVLKCFLNSESETDICMKKCNIKYSCWIITCRTTTCSSSSSTGHLQPPFLHSFFAHFQTVKFCVHPELSPLHVKPP